MKTSKWNLEQKNERPCSLRGGKLVKSEGIVIPGERLIRAMNDGVVDAYKYLGMLEGDEKKN